VSRADFLTGLRVLEIGDGIAGSSATSILWSLGADVTAVVDPSSPHRRGRPSVGPASVLSLVLDRGKRPVEVGDLAAALADEPDVVVVDRVGGALPGLDDVGAYASFVERHNRSAWVTISAFGLTGARAADFATELTVAAASGMLAGVRDPGTGQPLKLAGQQSLLNTGQAAALAVCHALDLATDGAPVHLDLSAVEATMAMGPVLQIGGLTLNIGAVGGAKRYGAPASFYECADGLIRISAMEDHQWQGVVKSMGSPDWADRFSTVDARIEGADEIDARVAEWARSSTKIEAESVLQSNGVPATAMYSPAEVLASPQLAHREAFERIPVGDGRDAPVVGVPFRVVDTAGEQRHRSLRGLRMLEASHVITAPLAGAVLGALGVTVTKLEDARRIDMYRRRGPYIDGEEGMERSAYFALVNHSKGSAAFDVDGSPARLAELLESSDVVLENLGAKRASVLGLASSVVLGSHPDLLAVSSSGFGQSGPHAAYRVYAYNLQAACALGYLTRTADGEPAEIDMAWADLISAYALSTIIAAWAVGPSGNRGVGLDFAMADLVVAHFNEFLAATSLAGVGTDDALDRANELAPFAPHGVYPAGDGWIAIAVDGDEQYERLVKVLADDTALAGTAFAGTAFDGTAFATPAGRFEQRAELDRLLADATRERVGPELAVDLRHAGVPAEVVVGAADLIASAHLESRGFLTTVEHPVWGRRRLVGIPWRSYGGPAIALGAPPLLDLENGDG
jgi:crotonobetainyl-CoA:carnitine CoA-transferase CaiB-like acyl-CoA transferase